MHTGDTVVAYITHDDRPNGPAYRQAGTGGEATFRLVFLVLALVSAASCSHVNTDMFVVLQIIIMPIYTFYRGGLKWCG